MPAIPHLTLTYTAIGSKAFSILQQNFSVHCAGMTSRGVFLKTEHGWILFLSLEHFRGPLTINLQRKSASALERFTPGMIGELDSRGFVFPTINLQIAAHQAQVWEPKPPLALKALSDLSFARQAHKRKPDAGFSALIPALLNEESTSQHPLEASIFSIQKALHSGIWKNIPQLAEPLFGYGLGLTPSGDDFLLGLLLTINRWGKQLSLQGNASALNTAIIQSAYQKTTTLSANLIECAAQGLADERLICALDALMGIAENGSAPLNDLFGWGNSSGIDALVGMLAAVLP